MQLGQPLAAVLTKASVHDATVAPASLDELPLDKRFVLADTHDQRADLHDECALHGRMPIARHWTPAAADDPGKPVRAVFHALRHVAAENLNELVKDLFGLHGTVPTTGFLATRAMCSAASSSIRSRSGIALNAASRSTLA